MDASELTTRLLDDPGLADAVLGELDAGGYSDKARLQARWMLSGALGIAPDEIIRDATFSTAARQLESSGDPTSAKAIAELSRTGAELTKAAREWTSRYSGRPRTDREQADAEVLASGRVSRSAPAQSVMGADGARYQVATLEPGSGGRPKEIAIVTTSAQTTEIVKPFADARERDAWISDRLQGREGPISSWQTGPQCRTAREEQVLAWALQHADGANADKGGWKPSTFLTHTRSEIFIAWVAASKKTEGRPDLAAVEDALEWQMLRAPWWGSLETGGRNGEAALSYLHRLAESKISTPQAMRAAQWLIREDRAAAAAQRAAWQTTSIGHPERTASRAPQPRIAPPGQQAFDSARGYASGRHQRI